MNDLVIVTNLIGYGVFWGFNILIIGAMCVQRRRQKNGITIGHIIIVTFGIAFIGSFLFLNEDLKLLFALFSNLIISVTLFIAVALIPKKYLYPM